MKTCKISVRELVEWILRSGDIESGLSGGILANKRALEGTRLHQKLQKKEKGDYVKEVPLSETLVIEDDTGAKIASLTVEGRADGIYTMDQERLAEERKRAKEACDEALQLSLTDNIAVQKQLLYDLETPIRVIDEIKSTALPLRSVDESSYPLHWAQAECYARFLAKQEDLNEVLVRLSYVQLETEEVKYLYRRYSRQELETFFDGLWRAYAEWIRFQCQWEEKRTQSLQAMSFPFKEYRSGQREMAVCVYQTISKQEKVFLQAPTGIGKTMSALFPALKALGEKKTEKLFYLTAKNVTAEAVENADELLRKNADTALKTIRITAKDRICRLCEKGEKRQCSPSACPYAKGHYDRVNEAVLQSLKTIDRFDEMTIRKLSDEYTVCPYELSLDIALWCDLVICDYNYAFDPTASLKRFFSVGKQNFTLLIDEAHNLVERARDMFSADLEKHEFAALKKSLSKEQKALSKSLSRVIALFNEQLKEFPENEEIRKLQNGAAVEEKWRRALEKVSDQMAQYLEKNASLGGKDEFLELYFRVLFFLRIWNQKEEGYENYFLKKGRGIAIRLFCVDPSSALKQAYKSVASIIYFSATLAPVDYYQNLLGAEDAKAIKLQSPFDASRKKVMTAAVPMNYYNRENSIPTVVDLIGQTVNARKGHYMAFFSSFAYLEKVAERFERAYPRIRLLKQTSSMEQEDRMEFLKSFREDPEPLIGFCALSGVFSEGIDLIGEDLVGVMIVSAGLPQVSCERNLIRQHMDEKLGSGFEYAYTYPGMGHVLQAAGRVIRTESDKGIILLIDERFTKDKYRRLYPEDWFPVEPIQMQTLPEVLRGFWKRLDNSKE